MVLNVQYAKMQYNNLQACRWKIALIATHAMQFYASLPVYVCAQKEEEEKKLIPSIGRLYFSCCRWFANYWLFAINTEIQ